MSKILKAFITRDDFVTPSNVEVAPIYELSDDSFTYAKRKETVYPTSFPNYAIHSFGYLPVNKLSENEANVITRAIIEFVSHVTGDPYSSKSKIITNFLVRHNSLFPTTPISSIDYNTVISYRGVRAPDYIIFTIEEVECSIWLADNTFNKLYPSYDISIVTPFDNFASTLNNTQETLNAILAFNLIEFNDRIEVNKDGYPPTLTRVMNIPFRIPNTELERDCYFAFNIYGINGNHEHILRLELYRYLTEVLGIPPAKVESSFPTILNINEFFIIPRWNRSAIPAQVGQISIASQISKTYHETIDLHKFVKIYDNEAFTRTNTYSVPSTYNNLLLHVLNGYRSNPSLKDFFAYYGDIITVSSMHPDFNRMKSRTQRFMILLENMLSIADSNSRVDLFTKLNQNRDYSFNITERAGVTYLTIQFLEHQYYVIPRYEYLANL